MWCLLLQKEEEKKRNHVGSTSYTYEPANLQGKEESCSNWTQSIEEKGRCFEGQSLCLTFWRGHDQFPGQAVLGIRILNQFSYCKRLCFLDHGAHIVPLVPSFRSNSMIMQKLLQKQRQVWLQTPLVHSFP